jgi:hypothetical protein
MSEIADRIRNQVAQRRQRRTVVERDVPGYGTVRFRQVDADQYLEAASAKGTGPWLRALVAASVVDEGDRPVFASADELAGITMEDLRPLSDIATEVNKADLDAAKKNSTTAPPSDSSSTSPSGSEEKKPASSS